MQFNYQARTKRGEIQTGVVEAASREVAIALLQGRGLFVTVLEGVTQAPIYARQIKLLERISRKDVVLFSRQVAIMFKSKIPLVESLRTLSAQSDNPDFKEKIFKMADEVEGGNPFSEALGAYPKVFSSFFIAMVKAGEASGKLSESLEYLADHLEREYYLTSRLRGAMVYPSLIFVFFLVVLVSMVFFVFPRLIEVLEETGQELPLVTVMIIKLTELSKQWGLVLFVLFIVTIILLIRYYRTQEGKIVFDNFFLKIPVIGPLLRMLYLSRFAENLSTLISGGLPIAQALEITGDIVGNSTYKKIILETREEVKRGEPISSRLSRAPEFFPPLFHQMTLVGEKTGTLDTTLMNVVEFYQKETDRRIDALLSVLEPVMIMILGFIVATLMLSVLLPLYQISTL